MARQKTYYAEVENATLTIRAYNKEEATEAVKDAGYVPIRVVSSESYHICKYCGRIEKGINKDVLCKECREIFGHDLYSEL